MLIHLYCHTQLNQIMKSWLSFLGQHQDEAEEQNIHLQSWFLHGCPKINFSDTVLKLFISVRTSQNYITSISIQ